MEALLKLLSALLPLPNHGIQSLYNSGRSVLPSFLTLEVHQITFAECATMKMNDVAFVLDRDFCNGLQHCRGSASAVSQNIKDMYDGLEYLQHCKPGGFLCQQSNPANISFTINTDGVALFNPLNAEVILFMTVY